MSAIQIFNVCTHAKDGGGGLSMGIPTPCVVSAHPTQSYRFATGGGDANVFIWHFSNHIECGLQNLAKLTYHTQPCNAVSWSSDGYRLATAGDDKMIAVWEQDQKYDPNQEQPAFGESMVFQEKWHPTFKIRGPLAEISDIEWLHDNKSLLVSSLDGNIGFYHIKKGNQIHNISINTQFIQGLALDPKLNLLAVATTAATAKVYRIIKQRRKKQSDNKYRHVTFATLSHYPYSAAELEQQQIYDLKYKEEKKELEEFNQVNPQKNSSNLKENTKVNTKGDTGSNTKGDAGSNGKECKTEGEHSMAVDGAENSTNTTTTKIVTTAPTTTPSTDSNVNSNSNPKPKPKAKLRKKRVAKCSLFKHNLITTSRKPHWSKDGLLLCMVAGVSRDKSNDCIHIFHRSNLTKKVTTITLPESSHATVARFHPLKLKLTAEGAEDGSIVAKYKMTYRMLLAVMCGSELFVFDTSKTKPVFYWKDQDTQNFFDMQWTGDGKALIISDVEGFLTRLCLAAEDFQDAL